MIPAVFAAIFLVLWGVFYASLPALRHSVRFLPKSIARAQQRYASYLPIAAIVVAGAALTAWSGDAFLDMAERLHEQQGKLHFVDTYVHDAAVQERTAGATSFFVLMSQVGGAYGMGAAISVVCIVLLVQRRYRWLLYLAVTAGGGGLLNLALKHHFARTRPDVAEMLRRASGFSFPSGHAMGSTVACGALAYLAVRALTSWKWKSAALAFAITFVAAVAASRVYLGVHWISDVGAGITAGTVWVACTTVAYETLRRVRLLRALRDRSHR
ncbi:MAG TPA: phosphatase PAP2 family protein [Thermoanaerobaculia bacterium]|nr:phosphatase PAP2 family protein [Thermoanaerobaculia bacterium]